MVPGVAFSLRFFVATLTSLNLVIFYEELDVIYDIMLQRKTHTRCCMLMKELLQGFSNDEFQYQADYLD
jgi:hypothetical protein